jgi:hypothetical protein
MRFYAHLARAAWRYVFALLFPHAAFHKLYAELARLDYLNDWREFRTLSGTRFWLTSSFGGPKLRSVDIPPFFFRLREARTPNERLIIEAREAAEVDDGKPGDWMDYKLTDGDVRDERRLLRELYAFHPCLPCEENNFIPRVVTE